MANPLPLQIAQPKSFHTYSGSTALSNFEIGSTTSSTSARTADRRRPGCWSALTGSAAKAKTAASRRSPPVRPAGTTPCTRSPSGASTRMGSELNGGKSGTWATAASWCATRSTPHAVTASQGPQRDALCEPARTAARLVAGGATTRLALSGPRSRAADDPTSAQSCLPCRCRGGWDREERVSTHAPPQLRHPLAGAERRCPRDPGPELDSTALYTRVARRSSK